MTSSPCASGSTPPTTPAPPPPAVPMGLPIGGSTSVRPRMTEHPLRERLDELNKRKEQALHAGSERSVERQHAKGKLLARERIEYLLDPGSFPELAMLARPPLPP